MAAFAGAGATGERVSSTFVFDPVFIMPDLSKREKTEIVFVAVFFHGGRAVVYDAEVALGCWLTSLSSKSFQRCSRRLRLCGEGEARGGDARAGRQLREGSASAKMRRRAPQDHVWCEVEPLCEFTVDTGLGDF